MIRPMLRLNVFLFLTLLFVSNANAQFTDSTNYLVQYTSAGSVNTTEESDAYLLNNALRLGIRKKTVSLNFNNNWIYGKQNQQLTNNDFSSTLDFNLYKTFPHFAYWGLANYNTSRSLKINNQLLAGVGVSYSLYDREEAYLNISNGVLFDASDIILEDGRRDKYETMRNSLRLSFRFVVFKNVTFSNTSFLQNSLSNGKDYIMKTDAGLTFKLNRWLGFNTSYKYNRVSRTNRENSLISYGLTFERYF
jgi:hypothetical protein